MSKVVGVGGKVSNIYSVCTVTVVHAFFFFFFFFWGGGGEVAS